MALDDPELQAAMATYAKRDRPGAFHVVFSLLLLAVHLGLFLVALAVIAMSAMWIDNCAYVDCGDYRWINRAMAVMLIGGGAVLAVDVVGVIYLMMKSRKAVWVPIVGCSAQLGLSVLALYMISLAGPL